MIIINHLRGKLLFNLPFYLPRHPKKTPLSRSGHSVNDTKMKGNAGDPILPGGLREAAGENLSSAGGGRPAGWCCSANIY